MTTQQQQQHKSMKTLFIVPSMLVLASSACFAGTTEVSGSPAPSIAPSSDPWMSVSAFAGYETQYYFRGLWFSNNNFSGGATLTAPVNEKLTFAAGALYTESVHTDVTTGSLDYSEMDIFASLSYKTDFATFILAATHYQFFDTFSGSVGNASYGLNDTGVTDATDFSLSMVKSFGNFNYTLTAVYDVRIDAAYFETGLDYTYAVTDKFSLVPVVQLGYGHNYYTVNPGDQGFTHVRTAITAPYKVTDSLTVIPMAAVNTSLEARDAQNRADQDRGEIYGGISVSYSF